MGFRVDTAEEANQKDFDRVSKAPGGTLAYLTRFPEALAFIPKPSLIEQMVAVGMVTQAGRVRPSHYRTIAMTFTKFNEDIVFSIAASTNQEIPNLSWYSDRVICRAIEREPNRFKTIPKPSEKVLRCYASQRHFDGMLIMKHNPSPQVLMRMIMTNPASIKYMPNPTREMMMKVVRKNGTNIQYLTNPPDDIVWEAVRKCGMAIEFVKNPSEELQRLAVSRAAQAITVIDNPIPELQIAAVEKSPNVIRLIKNPDEEAMWKALQQKPKLIASIKQATPEMESFAQIVS